jgi:GNAT superfamily N-acetyltransferase
MGLEFRRAQEADLAAEHDVFVAAQSELWHRFGLEWSASPFEAWCAPHRHLLVEDGERSFVALDRGRTVGFSAALVRDDVWYFSALFVLPDYQGQQVGRELLDRSWGADHLRRMTITDAFQPVSNGLYARRGLIPTTPILSLSGMPRCDRPRGLEVIPPELDALTALDRCAYGFARLPDHRYWAGQAAECNLWLRAGEPIAYSYVSAQGLIGPLGARDEEAAATVLQAELARREGQSATVLLPGTARGMVQIALASGLRFNRPPGLLLLGEHTEPPRALAISSYWLL